MAAPTVFASAVSNPGGTGSTLTVSLSTHAANDVLVIYVAKTGNVAWTVPAGWSLLDQRSIGTSSNGLVGTWFYRKVLSGDTLPLTNPVCTLGATVTRMGVCRTLRGADLEGPFVQPIYGARGFVTGTANPIRPPSVTTPAPDMLVLHCYAQRAATNAPDPTNYTQDQEIIISGTLVLNASRRTVTDQNTVLSSQDASPTSGARWVAGILCIPSPDYPYYRSGSSVSGSGTFINSTLPAGTSSSNVIGGKDLVIATVEAAGTAPSANTPGDWNEITEWSTTTSGGATTTKKYWALYDGTIDLRFNRTGSGEISVCVTTYYNADQTDPIGNTNVRQNASSTTSTWDALTRSNTKATIQATCIADGTPTYTSPSGWIERMDGLGIACSDQVFDATGSTASASFTLNSASPTLVGLLEIIGGASVQEAQTFERSASISASASITTAAQFFSIFARTAAVGVSATITTVGTFFSTLSASVSLSTTAGIDTTATFFSTLQGAVSLGVTSSIETAASFFSVFLRAIAISSVGSIETAGHGILERSSSVNAIGSVAVNGVRVVSRSASISASSGIEISGESFTLFTRTADVSVTGAISVSGARVVDRSSSIGAAASISLSSQFFTTFERSLTVQASLTIVTTGHAEVSRAVSVTIISEIATSGDVIGVFQRSVGVNGSGLIVTASERDLLRSLALDGVAAITVFGEVEGGISTFERSASLNVSASIGSVGLRRVDRSASLTADCSVETSSVYFSVVSSTAQIDASAEIQTGAITVRERTASVSSTAGIGTSADFYSILERGISVNTTVSIGVSGTISDVTEIERAVSLNVTGNIVTNGFMAAIILHPTNVSLTNDGQSSAVVASGVNSASLSGSGETTITLDG